MNHAQNFKSTTKARKTERTNIKSSTIALLSVLRKILAACIMKRINSKLNSAILHPKHHITK